MNLLDMVINQAGLWTSFINLMGGILDTIFRVLHKVGIENAALCIIIFTILVKAAMISLNIKQQKFSMLSSKMQPEMQKIQKKYKGKRDEESMRKQNMEMTQLYEKYGVSPMGGCLPLLITMPVVFALYRVIYNIPAHISYIGALYENIADALMETEGYKEILGGIAENYKEFKALKIDGAIDTKDEIVTLLTNFRTSHWNDLKEAFPAHVNVISENSAQIIDINKFVFGLNIADWPTTRPVPGLIIPILAVLVQWYQTRQISMSNEKQMSDNPTAQSMMMMTKIMPFFSGFICLTLPIGVGIYWVVGGVFQVVQQYFVKKYMDSIDLDELIAKNQEKARKKKIRMGLDPNASFSEIAQQNMRDKAKYKASTSTTVNNNNNNNANKNYKKGSISSYANMVYDSKQEKK